jgi:hypothetical protein
MTERTTEEVNALRLWRVLFYVSLAAYGLSLLLPAYYAGREKWPGWAALLLGFIGVIGWHFSGYANAFLWLSWASLRSARSVRALSFALVALVLAATFLLGHSIPTGSGGDSAYTIQLGYWVWLLSIGLTAIAAYAQHRATNAQSRGVRDA